MTRGTSKEVIMVRRYSWFDTAMPRMLQLAISYCNEGDFVDFSSDSFGNLGTLRVGKGGKFNLEMNPLVKSAPSLLKLMSEDPYWDNPIIKSAMNR
jgi:hypothetical protein